MKACDGSKQLIAGADGTGYCGESREGGGVQCKSTTQKAQCSIDAGAVGRLSCEACDGSQKYKLVTGTDGTNYCGEWARAQRRVLFGGGGGLLPHTSLQYNWMPQPPQLRSMRRKQAIRAGDWDQWHWLLQ
jgi:hypothetical protein